MGGKNHQPCAIYLKSSTKLSRFASAARARLELANIALEDVLLAELDGKRGEATLLLKELDASRAFIADALTTLADLHDEMVRNEYQDLPSLRKISVSATGTDFSREKMINQAAWNKVSASMKGKGFWGIIELFELRLKAIAELTEFLSAKISRLQPQIDKGELSLVVEQNRQGNFKIEFARLYNEWSEFEQEFLASSMLSTELWYQFNGFGSLRTHGVTAQTA